MKRLYCSLRGGFGNQLFQWAHAFSLAQRYCAELVLDDGWYRGRRLRSETARAFGLGCFDLPYRLPRRRERPRLALMDAALKLQKRLNHALLPIHFEALPLTPQRLAREPQVVMQGCWQQHRLVVPLKSQLQQQLRFRPGSFSAAHARALAALAEEPASVAVHVRRGDYVADPRTAGAHGVCSLDYYAAALAVVRQRLSDPHLFLFSDDLAWAQQQLPLQGFRVTVVDAAGQEGPALAALAEFDRMRHCRHAVIANSSFSWWAAFLLQTPESVVIAPRHWFSWGTPKDLYAPDWLLL
ncbi:MAG: alpha-1,2-fucosyltransferase [Cyanobacteriota bacterium]|nr:alpha-1,2-fucosyltransferase [Cyanobacteriota bacterium]